MNEQASDIFAGHFAGKKVLVTGAARGMGCTISRSFAEAGAAVLLVDRDDQVHETAKRMRADGLDARACTADVTDDAAVKAAVAVAAEEWGRIDVLVNNAGVISVERLTDLTTEEFKRVLDVNTVGHFIVAREAVSLLRESGGGVILNAASAQAREGFIFTPHYAASKFGVVGMTQSLAKELAEDNIRVNAYCPGIVMTDMWGYLDGAWGAKLGDYRPGELVAEWIRDIPLQRPATEADVANLLLFLASDAASYITGQTINVDGGMSMD
ncbi:SDR family oxidoreductase [Microtetraspora sp. AC03309]|uniref:SDR family NAD(P)-dependent oxidoreductase n=1 Tax=Microtetraspora sp. AC03309 TaxID=2779376 RepID=UPI001E2F5FE3|nr:SDR family NAD(P)-dependent oxidoreductase [Microtetraspora sp. AC03309]MCC5577829.1 SDR family oxidoreductase [Microtetraspora sp. AC03309]